MRIMVRSCFAANYSSLAHLSHLLRGQTQTRVSKPLKCGTSAIFDLKFEEKSVNLSFERCTFWQIS